MTDLQILPSNRAAIVGREPPSREYLRFFELLAKAYLQTGGAVADIAAIVTRIEALENADDISVVLKELENIAPGIVVRLPGNTWEARNVESADATRIVVTDGDGQAGNPTIDLAELTDTGTGAALVKITRDDYGRVEGQQAATAADLPFVNTGTGLAATNAQTAIAELAKINGGTVASAAALNLPAGRTFHVSGTTNITSITTTAIHAGAHVVLIFDGVLTFTDGSNLKLAGNFVTAADSTITLAYDGTNFYECCRSVN